MRKIRSDAVRIADILRGCDNILVAAHASPDGDAVGSTAAMGWLLHGMGKRFMLYNASELPEQYSWINLPQGLCSSLAREPFTPDLIVTLDCGEAARLGPELAELLPKVPSINLDHHPGNPYFGTLDNWVEPKFAATGQLVAEVARAADVPLSGGLAEAVYLALVFDTGSFAFGGLTGEMFRLLADLVDEGLDTAALREKLDNQWMLSKSRLWGLLLGRLEPLLEGRLLLVPVRRADLTVCGSAAEDLEGFAELLRRHKGVLITGIVREDAPDRCKLSLRSFGDVDVRALALRFGGGGHKNAAGAILHESVENAFAKVFEAVCGLLDAAA